MTLLELLENDDECKKKRKAIFYNFLYGLIFASAFFLGARLLTTSVRYEYARAQIKTVAEGRNYETLESLEEPPWSSDRFGKDNKSYVNKKPTRKCRLYSFVKSPGFWAFYYFSKVRTSSRHLHQSCSNFV